MSKRVAKFYDYVTVTPVGVKAPSSSADKAKFIDSILNTGKGVLVKTIAQHAARKTRNHAMYLPSKINTGRRSMLSRANGGTAGYDKPVLKNHDDGSNGMLGASSEGRVLGRAVGNTYIDYNTRPIGGLSESLQSGYFKLADTNNIKPMWSYIDVIDELNSTGLFDLPDWNGMGHLEVDALITDPDAVAQILDGRYLTVSTGMTSDRAICSVTDCHQDWVSGGPCDHKPGKDGCFLIAGDLRYEEAFSFVVSPGDDEAVISDFRIIDLPNLENKGYTTYHANHIKTDNNVYKLQASFVDSAGSNITMEETITTDSTLKDSVNQETISADGEETTIAITDNAEMTTTAGDVTATTGDEEITTPIITDDPTASDAASTVALSEATLGNVVANLANYEANQIVEHLIPVFSDSTSLKTLYDATIAAYVQREVEVPVTDNAVPVQKLNEAISTTNNLQVELQAEKDSKKFLRLELKDFYNQNTRITDERDSALATNHEVLSEYTALLRLADNRDGSFEDLKAEQIEKTVAELKSEFNELRTKFEFDKIILRPDGTSGNTQGTVEDPVLSGAGSHAESVILENRLDQEKKRYSQYIERYLYLNQYRGKSEAETYLHNMKAVGFVPRDLDMKIYTNSNDVDVTTDNGKTNT